MYELLKSIPLFADLPDSDLEAISSHAVTKNYPKNAVIINEGDTTSSLYLIVSGKVKAFLSDEQGKEIILNMQGPGEYFGELALLDDFPRSASVMTMEPSTFSIITKHDFDAHLDKNPAISKQLISALTKRVRELTENVRNLALLDVYGRVARTLLNMATKEDDHLVIDQKLTHQDIAKMVGSSREMVSRIMKDLNTGGYIRSEGKRTIIKEKLPPAW